MSASLDLGEYFSWFIPLCLQPEGRVHVPPDHNYDYGTPSAWSRVWLVNRDSIDTGSVPEPEQTLEGLIEHQCTQC